MFQRKKLGAPVQRGSVTSRVVKLFNDQTRQDTWASRNTSACLRVRCSSATSGTTSNTLSRPGGLSDKSRAPHSKTPQNPKGRWGA